MPASILGIHRCLAGIFLLGGVVLASCSVSSSGGSGSGSGSGGTIPSSGDYVAFSLDGSSQVVITEATDSSVEVGYDPFIAAALYPTGDYQEVLAMDGVVENSSGDPTDAERFVRLAFPPETGTHTDSNADDGFSIVYARDFNFDDETGEPLYDQNDDGASSITVSALGSEGNSITGSFDGELGTHTLTGSFRVTREEDGFFDDVPVAWLDVCDDADEEGELEADEDPEDASVENDQCDLWEFEATATGTVTVNLVPSEGDLDLYLSDDPEDEDADVQRSSAHDTSGPESITIEAESGEAFYIAVAGVDGDDYTIEIVQGLYDGVTVITDDSEMTFLNADTLEPETYLEVVRAFNAEPDHYRPMTDGAYDPVERIFVMSVGDNSTGSACSACIIKVDPTNTSEDQVIGTALYDANDLQDAVNASSDFSGFEIDSVEALARRNDGTYFAVAVEYEGSEVLVSFTLDSGPVYIAELTDTSNPDLDWALAFALDGTLYAANKTGLGTIDTSDGSESSYSSISFTGYDAGVEQIIALDGHPANGKILGLAWECGEGCGFSSIGELNTTGNRFPYAGSADGESFENEHGSGEARAIVFGPVIDGEPWATD